jgi:hypothetical protein
MKLEDDQAVQAAMKEEEVEEKIATADLQTEALGHEGEVRAELQQELPQVGNQGLLQLQLGMGLGQVEELEQVDVFKNLMRKGMQLSRRRRDNWRREDDAFEPCAGKLPFQLAPAPPFLDRKAHVILALFGPLAAAQDHQVVGPGQLSHQWCDFFVVLVKVVELPHPE